MAEILVVDCGSASGTQSVFALLDGLRVAAVSSVGELHQHLLGSKIEAPCAVICVACSGDNESRGLVDETVRMVLSRPVLVIDERFDDDFGRLLLEHGALDYLDADRLSTEKLHRRIEWAILRNGHRVATMTRLREPDSDIGPSDFRRVFDGLPRRQRQVLDLLLDRLSTKQIARQLGISAKTVHNQLASLRTKFGAASSQDMVIVVLRALHQE